MENRIPDTVRFAEPAAHFSPIGWKAFKDELTSVYKRTGKGTQAKMGQVLRAIEAIDLRTAEEIEAASEPKFIMTTDELTTGLVSKFIDGRPPGQSDWTLQGLLMTMRSLCNYAASSGYVRVSPFSIRRLSRWVKPEPPEEDGHLGRHEIRGLLDLLAKDVEERKGWEQWRARRLQCLVAIVAYAGLRKNEACRLYVSDIDLEASAIWLRPHGKRLKSLGSGKPVPIPKALAPIIANYLGHRMDAPYGYPLPKTCEWLIPTLNRKSPWVSGCKGSKPLQRLQAVAKRAGIEYITFQMLRRSWATHAEVWGLGEAMIQRVLRHASKRTTEEFYRKADIPNMARATAHIEF